MRFSAFPEHTGDLAEEPSPAPSHDPLAEPTRTEIWYLYRYRSYSRAIGAVARWEALLPVVRHSPAWTSRVLSGLVFAIRRQDGAKEDVLQYAEEALRLAEGTDNFGLRGLALFNLYVAKSSPEEMVPALLTCAEFVERTLDGGYCFQPGQVFTDLLELFLPSLDKQDPELAMQWCRRQFDNPTSDPSSRAMGARRLAKRLYRNGRLADRNAVLAELKEIGPSLGMQAVAVSLNAEAQAAAAEGRWHSVAEIYSRSIPMTFSAITRNYRAIDCAYAHLRLGHVEDLEDWTDLAEACLDAACGPSSFEDQRRAIARHRAIAKTMRGDVHGGISDLAQLVEKQEFHNTIAHLLETLASVLDAGTSADYISDIRLGIEGFEHPLTEFGLLFDSVLDWSSKAHLVARSRIVTACSRICLTQAAAPREGVLRCLATSAVALESTNRWLHRGEVNMALARFLADFDPGTAAHHAVRAVEAWQFYRAASVPADRSNLITQKRSQYLFAWELSARGGDPELSARAAEALRGSAIVRMMGDPLLDGQEVAEKFAEYFRNASLIEEIDADLDGDADGPRKQDRHGRARARAEAADLSRQGKLLQTVAPGSEAVTSGSTGSDIFVWVDVEGSDLYVAASTDVGPVFTKQVVLSNAAERVINQLSHPIGAQTVVKNPMPSFWGVMDELGEVVFGSLLDNFSSRPNIHISPGGTAWNIPWSCTRLNTEYLIQRANLALAISRGSTVWLDQRDRAPFEKVQAILDDKLPGTDAERAVLDQLLPGSIIVAPPGLSPDFRDYGAFIASVHGDYGAGGLAQIINFPTGPVRAAECFAWLFSPLTVFGSCWLGRFDASTDGEPLGLILPVLVRGARTMIAGTFGIHDRATGSILAQMYSDMNLNGTHPTKALAAGQRKWLRDHPTSPPYQWAGLIAIGAH